MCWKQDCHSHPACIKSGQRPVKHPRRRSLYKSKHPCRKSTCTTCLSCPPPALMTHISKTLDSFPRVYTAVNCLVQKPKQRGHVPYWTSKASILIYFAVHKCPSVAIKHVNVLIHDWPYCVNDVTCCLPLKIRSWPLLVETLEFDKQVLVKLAMSWVMSIPMLAVAVSASRMPLR